MIYLFNFKHVVKNIQVKLWTIIEVGGTFIYLNLEKLRMFTCNILGKTSYAFRNQITKAFLIKDVEVRMIKNHLTKPVFYWMRTLKTLYPDVLNIENGCY